jgi:hypothetical protein
MSMLNKLHARFWLGFCGGLLPSILLIGSVSAEIEERQRQEVHCDLLIIGGGISGVAAAYEALKAGRDVCLTDITDWLGGQATSEGVSALDEELDQPHSLVFPRGYLEFRQRIADHYGTLNPGRCWVSDVCFLPRDGDRILLAMLQDAAKAGNGTLRWFPNTVIKDLKIAVLHRQRSDQLIQSVTGIQHRAAPKAPPLNTYPLSQTLAESYRDRHSALFHKTVVHFLPPASGQWYVLEASETGEVLALADVPYRVGIDPRSNRNPSASSAMGDAYCTQGFTYSFAVEATGMPQQYPRPGFYNRYAAYYSYGVRRLASLPLVFTYRRIWSANRDTPEHVVTSGDISLQNWTWGNDYRPGTAKDNLIYTRQQLLETGQLQPGGWEGGLRINSLQQAEQLALGYFYWLGAGTTDSQLGSGVKYPDPHLRYIEGWKSPMGTAHGLSKYPYIREGRRLLGRPSQAYPQGFSIDEIDISHQDYGQPFYQQALSPMDYRALKRLLKQLGETGMQRTQSTRYPDSVGIGHYPIDIHPCMALSPPERSGNYERLGETQGRGNTYPFQIPLRAMIPQRINNLLVTGKSIATSHISAAAYRTQPIEWSAGAAAGTTAVFALERNIWPYHLVENMPFNPNLSALQQRLRANGNPTDIPRNSSWWLWGLGCIGLGTLVFLIWKRLQLQKNAS